MVGYYIIKILFLCYLATSWFSLSILWLHQVTPPINYSMGVDRVYTYIASLGTTRTVAGSGQSWASREYNKCCHME